MLTEYFRKARRWLVGSGGNGRRISYPTVLLLAPFSASHSAYRNALSIQNESNLKVNADIMRTRWNDLEARYR